MTQFKIFVVSQYNLETATHELNKFLRSHRVVKVEKEFVADSNNSAWYFCVTYEVGGESYQGGSRPPRVDYKEILDDEQFELFSHLRDVRSVIAEEKGIPVYAIMTNEQLSQIVLEKIESLNGLSSIKGIGKARIEKYGKAIIDAINEFMAASGEE